MAYIVPPTFTPGAILTAAQMTILGNDILAGGPIYATEAARDAAITSPFEGQRAYITTPTIPAATGNATYLPDGIHTLYTGTAWACLTPVSAFTFATGTRTGAYSATLAGSPGTNPSVTLVTGRLALVSISAIMNTSSNGTGANMSVAVSGATTTGSSNDYRCSTDIATLAQNGMTFVFPNLTAGTNTFTLQYEAIGVTGTFFNRRITANAFA